MPGLEDVPSSRKEVKKLVLCFDGTGNTFQGNTSDTNIVKIYDKLDRDDDNQYHYYQPGIGTYDISGGSLNKGAIGNFASKISRTVDQGLATSFDAHVMAGYKFLMRYYDSGDKIYMFGFSRGAFTARFLARMVNTVGLLSKGNDEMVPFAYQLYQQYEQAKESLGKEGLEHQNDEHSGSPVDVDAIDVRNKLNAFTSTFCRRDKTYNADHTCYSGVKIYFLGIFDCVSSVAVLETPFGKTPKPVSVVGTAEHVRHAVAVDEFRVKFKASLLNQDVFHEKYGKDEDIKEVWFPGNHGDVGGGWPAVNSTQEKEEKDPGFWKKLVRIFGHHKDDHASKDVKLDAYQMSDIALSWMIRELEVLGDQEKPYALKWSKRLQGFKDNFNHEQALHSRCHNTMAVGGGSSFFKVLFWNFMDYLPLFPRWELEPHGWALRTFPANMASARDMPKSVLLHASLVWRLRNGKKFDYKPRNNHGEGPGCLDPKRNYLLADDGKNFAHRNSKATYVDHSIYALDEATVQKYKDDAKKAADVARVISEVPTLGKPVSINGNAPTVNVVPNGVKGPSQVTTNAREIFA